MHMSVDGCSLWYAAACESCCGRGHIAAAAEAELAARVQDAEAKSLSVQEQKEQKVLKLLLKIKNGTPAQRKSALRHLTDKVRTPLCHPPSPIPNCTKAPSWASADSARAQATGCTKHSPPARTASGACKRRAHSDAPLPLAWRAHLRHDAHPRAACCRRATTGPRRSSSACCR